MQGQTLQLDQQDIEAGLGDYVRALVAGDRAAALNCLSPRFTRHMGLDAGGFVDYEIAEFRPRVEPYFLKEGTSVKIHDWNRETGDIDYFVFNRRGQMIYEEQNRIDEAGRLTGDGGEWEFISKLKFRKDAAGRVEVIRGLCLRHQRWKPTGLVVYNHAADNLSLKPSSYDEYASVCEFHIEGDAGTAITADVMVTAGIPGSRERKSLVMRGTDHPYYLPDLFPVILGCTIRLPAYPLIYWALNVETADGKRHRLYNPAETEYVFDEPVVFAVLNDAVDNDWEVVTG